MGYINDDINSIFGDNQLNGDNDEVNDVLNGDYDDILDQDDELESLMDADEDSAFVEDTMPNDDEVIRAIVDESQGVNEDGLPNAAISLLLDMVSFGLESRQTIAQQAMYKPVLTINKRLDFVELVLTFPTPVDTNLQILFAHLNTFGQKAGEVTEHSDKVPLCSITIVPISGLGSYYMVATNPVLWALSSERPNEPPKDIKIIVRSEDVGFFQTDEIDLRSIESAIQREQMELENALYDMEAQDRKDSQKDYLNDLFDEGE